MAKKLGDEGMPFLPADKRKAGVGDEGLPLKKKKVKKKKQSRGK